MPLIADVLNVRNDKIRLLLREHQSPREQLRVLLEFYIESSHLEEGRLGCMVVGTAIELATHDSEIKFKVGNALDRNERRLADLIRLGQEQGKIGADIDAGATAQLMLALFQGLRVLGKSRHENTDMTGVVKTAMRLLD
ncbi:TetR family transcriptional regulator C-terminal domain-containing protein [Pseudomonas sp. nanlin1]|uniref:TetR family transcriptional regulator C-terminal domain-containing protein n=1 Tax=Pseudomonas sp. nanlin1 TaxID=3040605 RepID=UPI00388EDDDB